MTHYLEIAVNVPSASGIFHYHLPQELEGQVSAGGLVLVPFGPQVVQGVIVGFTDQPDVSETRPILDLLDPAITLTAGQIELARWMSHAYLAPLADCIGLMLPPGLEQRADSLYSLVGRIPDEPSPTQKRIIKLLSERGPLRGQQLEVALRRVNWRASIRPLLRGGVLKSEPVLPPPRVKPKQVRTARLSVSADQAQAALDDLGRAGSAALQRRQAVLRCLIQQTDVIDIPWLYAESGGNSSDLRYLQDRGLIELGEQETWRNPLERMDFPVYEAPSLTRDQLSVWEQVHSALTAAIRGEHPAPLLLHGVTGSGKTEIYLQAVQEALSLNRQVIVLVPEIALTPQTIQRFAGRFPERVGLLHSGLSDGERYDTWRRARLGELDLVVGPRSALFTPFERLGLIVVDECHDDSYYQAEPAPHFNARETAVHYAGLSSALCLMGSATPDVTSIYRAEHGEWKLAKLPERILAHRLAVQSQMRRLQGSRKAASADASRYRLLEGEAETIELPPVRLVDMRIELQADNRSIFSRLLQQRLAEVLQRSEQAILFLNRRGSATYVFCRDCGYVLRCPRCDVPLTFHDNQAALICHYCGYRRNMPSSCPSCKGQRIRQYGAGTQKVETELQALFPGVRILRWDFETTRKKGAHAAILGEFAAQRADVLVGTQMLAKGMDLPLVTLVGVVLADVGLNLPDYRANERTFQVLTQVAGRAGRSPLGGEVILQTFQPDHYVIQAASRHDMAGFYARELAYRRELGYPPFVQIARLEYRSYDPQKAEQSAETLAERLDEWIKVENRRQTRLIGPAPCFFGRISGMYRWQIVVAGPDPASLLRGRPLGDWRLELNPPSLL